MDMFFCSICGNLKDQQFNHVPNMCKNTRNEPICSDGTWLIWCPLLGVFMSLERIANATREMALVGTICQTLALMLVESLQQRFR